MKKWPKSEWSREKGPWWKPRVQHIGHHWRKVLPKVYHISSKDSTDGNLHVSKSKAYISRWILLGGRSPWAPQLLINQIHHTDINDCHHDHPWDFWTLVLWGGYVEEVKLPDGTKKTKRRWPGQLSFRPAEHTHLITKLPWGKSYTLVWQKRKRRDYGYHTREGWMHYKVFLRKAGEKGIAWCKSIADDDDE